MELQKLIQVLDAPVVTGTLQAEIAGIQSDSRRIEPGFLFVAVRGTAVDGHTYIAGALEKVQQQWSARKYRKA